MFQQIGEGGCGVVYMAEQAEPVRRRVALKMIQLGMDTKSVIARFEAERQALALMDHANIAKVFDAGSTERPLARPEGKAKEFIRVHQRPSAVSRFNSDRVMRRTPRKPFAVTSKISGLCYGAATGGACEWIEWRFS